MFLFIIKIKNKNIGKYNMFVVRAKTHNEAFVLIIPYLVETDQLRDKMFYATAGKTHGLVSRIIVKSENGGRKIEC